MHLLSSDAGLDCGCWEGFLLLLYDSGDVGFYLLCEFFGLGVGCFLVLLLDCGMGD